MKKFFNNFFLNKFFRENFLKKVFPEPLSKTFEKNRTACDFFIVKVFLLLFFQKKKQGFGDSVPENLKTFSFPYVITGKILQMRRVVAV